MHLHTHSMPCFMLRCNPRPTQEPRLDYGLYSLVHPMRATRYATANLLIHVHVFNLPSLLTHRAGSWKPKRVGRWSSTTHHP
eukprot:2375194-Prymnesium_polylepis.1